MSIDYLNITIEEFSKLKSIDDILLFGSAVKSENYGDIDILLYSHNVFSPLEVLEVVKCMHELENKYNDLAFTFSSGNPRKKAECTISLCPDDNKRTDEILEYSISLNNRVLYGKNPYNGYKRPPVEYFLSILDRFNDKNESSYEVLKQYLFLGLLYKGISEKKENLLSRFEKEYGYNFDGNNIATLNYDTLKIDEVYNLIKKNFTERPCEIRKYDPVEKFLYDVHGHIMKHWETDSLGDLENYLIKQEENFKENSFLN